MSDARTVYAKARAETAKLLGYGDDLETLTPEQSTRLDIACALRIALDDSAAKLLRGESSDVSKLLSASEALAKLLPATVLASPPPVDNVDPRETMLKTYLDMRRRAVPAISEHGNLVDSLRASLISLAEEIEAAAGPALGELAGANATPSGANATPSAPSNVVALPRATAGLSVQAPPPAPPPTAAAPAPTCWDETENGRRWQAWHDAGGGGHDWGPV
jgi:hypothetical protein